MRRDFLAHLYTLSLRFFSGTRFGDIVTRFNRDLSALQEVATGALLGFASSVLTLVGTVAWAVYYDWSLFLMAALPFPFAVAVALPFRRQLRTVTRRLRELSADQASMVVEGISGIRTVRSFGRERGELRRFVAKGHQLIRSVLALQLTSSLASGLPRLFVVGASIVVYVVGGRRVIRGEMELGELVAMSMYVGMIHAPLLALIETWMQLVQARVSLERVTELRLTAPEVIEDPGAPMPVPLRGAIEFERVHFRYHPEHPVLEEVSFRIQPGETVALVGPSGAGKSTLIDLVYRFLDPTAGRVSIDGQDLRAIRMAPLRRRMAVISQESFLFHDSLYENVRYASPRADRESVLRAAELAGIDAMLPALADGWETLVGERGTRLSGGQRQRVSIARALLREPAILVLDEATSSLDLESDRAIRERIARLLPEATTIVITHRVDSLSDVDRVLRLERGRIVEGDRSRCPSPGRP